MAHIMGLLAVHAVAACIEKALFILPQQYQRREWHILPPQPVPRYDPFPLGVIRLWGPDTLEDYKRDFRDYALRFRN